MSHNPFPLTLPVVSVMLFFDDNSSTVQNVLLRRTPGQRVQAQGALMGGRSTAVLSGAREQERGKDRLDNSLLQNGEGLPHPRQLLWIGHRPVQSHLPRSEGKELHPQVCPRYHYSQTEDRPPTAVVRISDRSHPVVNRGLSPFRGIIVTMLPQTQLLHLPAL